MLGENRTTLVIAALNDPPLFWQETNNSRAGCHSCWWSSPRESRGCPCSSDSSAASPPPAAPAAPPRCSSPQREARNEAYEEEVLLNIVISPPPFSGPFFGHVFEQQQHTSLSSGGGVGEHGASGPPVRELLFALWLRYRNRRESALWRRNNQQTTKRRRQCSIVRVPDLPGLPNFASISSMPSNAKSPPAGFWNGGRSLVRVEWLVFHFGWPCLHADLLSNATTRTGNDYGGNGDDDARPPPPPRLPDPTKRGSFDENKVFHVKDEVF